MAISQRYVNFLIVVSILILTACREDVGAPSIAGTPKTSIVKDVAYSFVPSASDPEGAPLTFSILNQPVWAIFDTTTGALTGTPLAGDVGIYSGIVISVTDGEYQLSLPVFSISVEAIGNDSVTLSWMPPTENEDGSSLTDLAGYKIHWGTTSGDYTSSVTIDNPGIATYVVENLGSGTYYFVATALNAQGVESAFANELTTTIQ